MENKELFEKCKALRKNEYLKTTFGSDTYTIERSGDKFVIKEFRHFDTTKDLPAHEHYFDNVTELALIFMCKESWYTTNVFTGRYEFKDNDKAMRASFKVHLKP